MPKCSGGDADKQIEFILRFFIVFFLFCFVVLFCFVLFFYLYVYYCIYLFHFCFNNQSIRLFILLFLWRLTYHSKTLVDLG